MRRAKKDLNLALSGRVFRKMGIEGIEERGFKPRGMPTPILRIYAKCAKIGGGNRAGLRPIGVRLSKA